MRQGEGLREGAPSPLLLPILACDKGGSLVVVWPFPARDFKGALWCIAVNCPSLSSLRLKGRFGNGRAESLGMLGPGCWGPEEGGYDGGAGWGWGWFGPQGG